MSPDTIGKMIKRARIAKGWTQKQLALEVYDFPMSKYATKEQREKDIVVKTVFMSGIERDKSSIPDHLLKKFTELFDLCPKVLINLKVEAYRRKLTAKSK